MIFTNIVIILLFVNFFCKIKNRKLFYIISVAIIAGYGYFINPTSDMDLYRHFQMMDRMRKLDLQSLFNANIQSVFNIQSTVYEGTPVSALFFWGVSRLNNNHLLLPIAYLTVYGSLFALLYMASFDFSISRQGQCWGYAFILLLTNAYSLTGVRNMMAFSLFAVALYVDLVRKKYRIPIFILYFILCLFHDSTVILCVLRIILIFAELKYFWVVRVSIVVWPYFIDQIQQILTSFNGTFWSGLSGKIVTYTEQVNMNWMGGQYGFIRFYVRLFIILLLMIIMFLQKKQKISKMGYTVYYDLVGFFCVGALVTPVIAVRYIPFGLFLGIPLFSEAWKIETATREKGQICKVCILTILLLMVIYFMTLLKDQYVYLI